MKKLLLLLMLITPVLSWAQIDDMYFVPKKEKKVLVVKSAEEVYFTDDNNTVVDVVDDVEYVNDVDEAYYTNDLYDVVSDGEASLQLISVLSDGYCYANAPTAAKMVPATDTEQAIDHVLVDLNRREIRFTRIGAGEDRLYRY